MKKYLFLLSFPLILSCVSTQKQSFYSRRPSSDSVLKVGVFGGIHLEGFFGDSLVEKISAYGEVSRFAIRLLSSQRALRNEEYKYVNGYVEDSHVRGERLGGEAKYSSTISRRMTSQFLTKNFDVVILQLMDFQLDYSDEGNRESIRDLIDMATGYGKKCYFISSTYRAERGVVPRITNDKKEYFIKNILKEVITEDSNCKLINSFDLMPEEEVETLDDGLRLTEKASEVWADRVVNFIQDDLDLDNVPVVKTVDVDSRGMKIGVFGESHTAQSFGDQLVKDLSVKGEVFRFAVGGMTTITALDREQRLLRLGSLRDRTLNGSSEIQERILDTATQGRVNANLIKEGARPNPILKTSVGKSITNNFLDQDFDMIVLQFMDNQGTGTNQDTIKDMADLAASYADKCYFVSATYKNATIQGKEDKYKNITDTTKLNYVNNVLKPALRDHKCKLINSLDLMEKLEVLTVDGLHLDKDSGDKWGERVARAILSDLGGVADVKPEEIAVEETSPEEDDANQTDLRGDTRYLLEGDHFISSSSTLYQDYISRKGNPKAMKHLSCIMKRYRNRAFKVKKVENGEVQRCNRLKGDGFELTSKNHDRAILIDYTKTSNLRRFYNVDFKNNKTRYYYVSHGRHGKGDDSYWRGNTKLHPEIEGNSIREIKYFSNKPGSNGSSTGFYIAGHKYLSKKPGIGIAMVLHGLEEGVNDYSCERATIIHGNGKVKEVGAEGANWMSSGCPMLDRAITEGTIDEIKSKGTRSGGGAIVFVYGPREAALPDDYYCSEGSEKTVLVKDAVAVRSEEVRIEDCSVFDQPQGTGVERTRVACVENYLRAYNKYTEDPAGIFNFGDSNKHLNSSDKLILEKGFRSFYSSQKKHCMGRVILNGNKYYTASKYLKKEKDCEHVNVEEDVRQITPSGAAYSKLPPAGRVSKYKSYRDRVISERPTPSSNMSTTKNISALNGIKLARPLGGACRPCGEMQMRTKPDGSIYPHPGSDLCTDSWSGAVYSVFPGRVVEVVEHCRDNCWKTGSYSAAGEHCPTKPGEDDRGLGNRVVVMHESNGKTWYSWYQHLDKVSVKKNDVVSYGQKIGTYGSTGVSFSPHLHFEIFNSAYVRNNPRLYYPQRKICKTEYINPKNDRGRDSAKFCS